MPDTITPDTELSVNDEVEEKTEEQNAEAVEKATGKKASTTKKKSEESKTPTLSTHDLAAEWIIAQLEEHGPLTKAELEELAEKTNPSKFNHPTKAGRKVPRDAKWINANPKSRPMIPGNASGHYVNEGLSKLKIQIDSETKKISKKS